MTPNDLFTFYVEYPQNDSFYHPVVPHSSPVTSVDVAFSHIKCSASALYGTVPASLVFLLCCINQALVSCHFSSQLLLAFVKG